MKSRDLSAKEIIAFIERAAKGLEWSTRYTDLAATATGAVFRAMGLDEESERLGVSPDDLAEQLEALSEDLENRGRTRSTIRTYQGTWRRTAVLAYDWLGARDAGAEKQWWDGIGQFKDSRVQRRTTRDVDREQLRKIVGRRVNARPGVAVVEGADPTQRLGARIAVNLDDGEFPLRIPAAMSPSEALTVIDVVLRHVAPEADL